MLAAPVGAGVSFLIASLKPAAFATRTTESLRRAVFFAGNN